MSMQSLHQAAKEKRTLMVKIIAAILMVLGLIFNLNLL